MELNAFGLVLTEKQIIPSATVDDIDFGAVRAYMQAQGLDVNESPQPARENDLRNASVVDELDGIFRPTLYGLMTFGRDPQAFPHTLSLFVQCAAYGGADQAADVLSAGEGKGRLEDQVQRAMGWFRSLGRRESYEGHYRIDTSPVPEHALREALVNAVIHRDYAITGSQVLLEAFDDRIVVTSPGALPNHMTVEQARRGGAPRSRNEMMANAPCRRTARGTPPGKSGGGADFLRSGWSRIQAVDSTIRAGAGSCRAYRRRRRSGRGGQERPGHGLSADPGEIAPCSHVYIRMRIRARA